LVKKHRGKELPFFIILAAIAVIRLMISVGRFMPVHDTFLYMILQYTMLFNEPALGGGVPLWMPFISHGVSGNFLLMGFGTQGILVSTLSFLAPLIKNINFFYIFQAGLFFDELALLLGCILLSRLYFKSAATVFFVSSAVVLTAISSCAVFFDFHLFYLLPLLLYCLIMTLKHHSAKYLFFTGMLAIGTILGSIAYFLSLTLWILLVFMLASYLYFPRLTFGRIRGLIAAFRARHVLAVLVPLFFAGIIGLCLRGGLSNIVCYEEGRGANWGNSGSMFMSYGGYTQLTKFLELISRHSNNIDNSIYAGLLIVPFIFVALTRSRSRSSYIYATMALMMVMFGSATFISGFFYKFFPLGRFFRHIGLTAPVAKLFLIFYAGFGFDEFWKSVRSAGEAGTKRFSLAERSPIFLAFFSMLAIFLLCLIHHIGVFKIFTYQLWPFLTKNQLYASYANIASAERFLLILAAVYLVILFLTAFSGKKKTVFILACALIAVHFFDLFSYKIERELGRCPRVSSECIGLFKRYDYKFPLSRSQEYLSSARLAVIQPFLFEPGIHTDSGLKQPFSAGWYGTLYWETEAFLFFNSVSSIFRTDFWASGVDRFYKVWVPAQERTESHLGFPIPDAVAFRKFAAWDYPKLQIFSRIHILADDNAVAKFIGRAGFKGDIVLTSSEDVKMEAEDAKAIDIYENDRRDDNISIEEFKFDKLRVSVNNTAGRAAVLYYSDAWHPKWRAIVNGVESPVLKTNLAYKSVVIPPGKSDVTFLFGSRMDKLMVNIGTLLSVLVLGIIIYLVAELRKYG